MVFNFLTQNEAPATIIDREFIVRSTDLPTPHALLHYDTSGMMFAILDVSEGTPVSIKTELGFLASLGLAIFDESNTTAYVSDKVKVLYDATGGVFAKYKTTSDPQQKADVLKPLVKLLIDYTLPGRKASLTKAKGGIAVASGYPPRVDAELQSIEQRRSALDAYIKKLTPTQ